jgi:hypothetical protein
MIAELQIARDLLPSGWADELFRLWEEEHRGYYGQLPEWEGGLVGDPSQFEWHTRSRCVTRISRVHLGREYVTIRVEGHRSGIRWPFDFGDAPLPALANLSGHTYPDTFAYDYGHVRTASPYSIHSLASRYHLREEALQSAGVREYVVPSPRGLSLSPLVEAIVVCEESSVWLPIKGRYRRAYLRSFESRCQSAPWLRANWAIETPWTHLHGVDGVDVFRSGVILDRSTGRTLAFGGPMVRPHHPGAGANVEPGPLARHSGPSTSTGQEDL